MEEWDVYSRTFSLLDIGENGAKNSTANYTIATALNKFLTKCTEIAGTPLVDIQYRNCSAQQKESMIRAEQFVVQNAKQSYRNGLNATYKDMVALGNVKISDYKTIIYDLIFICPLCELVIILIIIPSLVIVYRLATTILYQLCEIPMQYCKTLIEQANKFSEDMQLPMLKLAKIFTTIDFQDKEETPASPNKENKDESSPQARKQAQETDSKKEEDMELLMQNKIEEDEMEMKKKVEEKRKLFSKYNGRKAKIFLFKVVLLLVPIFLYAGIDFWLTSKYFNSIVFVLGLNEAVINLDISPGGMLFLLREALLINQSIYDSGGKLDMVDNYLNKTFASTQQILEYRKDLNDFPKFKNYIDYINTNNSCKEVSDRLGTIGINVTIDVCMNVSHKAMTLGYNNAMLYFLRIMQDTKFRLDYTLKTASFLYSQYFSPDMIEGLDLYNIYIKTSAMCIFSVLQEDRQNYFTSTIQLETIKLVIELMSFLLVFLVIWVNIINSLQHDVNTTKGVLNIFPTKYILPQKSFLSKIKASFVFK